MADDILGYQGPGVRVSRWAFAVFWLSNAMNLLMMGFPMAIGMAFLILVVIMPLLMQAFSHIIDAGFEGLARLISDVRGGPP